MERSRKLWLIAWRADLPKTIPQLRRSIASESEHERVTDWRGRISAVEQRPTAENYANLLADLARAGQTERLSQIWLQATRDLRNCSDRSRLPAATVIRAHGSRIRDMRQLSASPPPADLPAAPAFLAPSQVQETLELLRAEAVFEAADEVVAPDDSSPHNAMIYAYCQAGPGSLDKALSLLDRLLREPARAPDPRACTGLARRLADAGRPAAALRLLSELERRGCAMLQTRGLYRSIALACVREAEALANIVAKHQTHASATRSASASGASSAGASNPNHSTATEQLGPSSKMPQKSSPSRRDPAARLLLQETLEQRLDDAVRALEAMERHSLGFSASLWRAVLKVCALAGDPRRAELCAAKLRGNGHEPDAADFARLCLTQVAAGELSAAEKTLQDASEKGVSLREHTYVAVVRAYGQRGDQTGAKRCFSAMEKAGVSVGSLGKTAYLRALLRTGLVEEALREFERFRVEGGLDRVMWNFLLHVYAVEVRDVARLLEAFEDARVACGPPDIYSYNALVNGLCKAGEAAEARLVLDRMAAAGVPPDIVTYNCVINAYADQNRIDSALALVDEALERGVSINRVTYRSLQKACASSGALVSLILDKEERQLRETAALNPTVTFDGTVALTRGFNDTPLQHLENLQDLLRNDSNGSGGSEAMAAAAAAAARPLRTGAFRDVRRLQSADSLAAASEERCQVVDLHGLLVPEAKAVVLMQIADMRVEHDDALHAASSPPTATTADASAAAAAAAAAAAGAALTPAPSARPAPAPPALIIITGAGKHRVGTPAVVRSAVLEMLSDRGIASEVLSSNSGRVRISAEALQAHFRASDAKERARRLAGMTTWRYMLGPVLVAAGFVLPKLMRFM